MNLSKVTGIGSRRCKSIRIWSVDTHFLPQCKSIGIWSVDRHLLARSQCLSTCIATCLQFHGLPPKVLRINLPPKVLRINPELHRRCVWTQSFIGVAYEPRASSATTRMAHTRYPHLRFLMISKPPRFVTHIHIYEASRATGPLNLHFKQFISYSFQTMHFILSSNMFNIIKCHFK